MDSECPERKACYDGDITPLCDWHEQDVIAYFGEIVKKCKWDQPDGPGDDQAWTPFLVVRFITS